MFKNTAAQKLTVFAFDSTTNLPKTGDAANITAYVDKDDAGVNVLADTTATEKDATNAKGYYIFDLAQAETNGDKLTFSAKSSTANIVVIGVPAVVYTLPAGFTSAVSQTGDAYAVVNDAAFGNAKLVRSTTPANALDVSATGEAGLDFSNIKDAAGAHTLTNITVPVVSVVTGAVGSVTGAVGSVGSGGISASSFAAGAITAAVIATDAIDADAIAASAVTEIQSGLSTLDATGVRTAVGLASANLDTQFSIIAGYIDTEVGSIKTITEKLDGMLVLDGSVYQFTANALELGPAGGGGSGLTAQQTRDALLLAPTGAAGPGSIDAILATLVPGSPVDETHSSEVEING